jgi:hypothetical protein
MAVEALGKICEYHRGKIEGGSMVISSKYQWCLP